MSPGEKRPRETQNLLDVFLFFKQFEMELWAVSHFFLKTSVNKPCLCIGALLNCQVSVSEVVGIQELR